MNILLLKYLGILFLKLNNLKFAIAAEKNCSELLSYKHQEGDNVIGTIFEYSLPYHCFICTRKNTSLRRQSVFDVHLYNNLLDFGFSGIFFPSEYNAQIRMTEDCFLKINFKSDKKTEKINYKVELCVKASKSACNDTGYSREEKLEFDNWNCFYVALAFVEKNKIHIAFSVRCQYIASRYFRRFEAINITNEKCLVDINNNDLHASITTEMSEDFAYDGYPVILPCSPGGYAVDPFTGKFVIDDQCYRLFSEVSRNIETDGINFLINKVYNKNENLHFPIKTKKPYDLNPTYIHKISGEPYSRKEMKVKNQTNVLKGNRKRIDCNYEVKGKSSKFPPCEDLFIDNIVDKPKKDSINYYVHRNGCFLCSRATCDFNNAKCNRTSVIKDIPVYNNILEFGISALHFPQETIVKIKINSKCYYKIHFTTSNLCNKFASTEYFLLPILRVKDKSCSYFQKDYKFMADYEFKHHNPNTHSGIPLLVPCSTGGVIVDPRTGRFTSGQSCRKMIREACRREKGLLFVIEKFYNNNEDYLFMTESKAELKYPWPVYLKKDKTFISFDDGIPKIVPNEEIIKKSRQGCYFIEETSTKRTLPFVPNDVTKRPQRGIKLPFKGLSTPKKWIAPAPSPDVEETSEAGYATFDIMILLFLGVVLTI